MDMQQPPAHVFESNDLIGFYGDDFVFGILSDPTSIPAPEQMLGGDGGKGVEACVTELLGVDPKVLVDPTEKARAEEALSELILSAFDLGEEGGPRLPIDEVIIKIGDTIVLHAGPNEDGVFTFHNIVPPLGELVDVEKFTNAYNAKKGTLEWHHMIIRSIVQDAAEESVSGSQEVHIRFGVQYPLSKLDLATQTLIEGCFDPEEINTFFGSLKEAVLEEAGMVDMEFVFTNGSLFGIFNLYTEGSRESGIAGYYIIDGSKDEQ